MRLSIDVFATEQLLGAFDGGLFDDVDKLRAAVEAVARVTFQCLVGDLVTERVQHGATDDIFGRYQLDLIGLAPGFVCQSLRHHGIGIGERCGEEIRCGHVIARRRPRAAVLSR